MAGSNRNKLGQIIRSQRVTRSFTQSKLAQDSGVSQSHLGRIERGERFPSARVLRRLAKPLGFNDQELMILAGYLSPHSLGEESPSYARVGRVDPYVAKMLGEQPPDVQCMVLNILSILKTFRSA